MPKERLVNTKKVIIEKLDIILKSYDLTKDVKTKIYAKDGIVVIAVIPYKHIYIFVIGKDRISLMKKGKVNPSMDYLSLVASTINKGLF